MGEQIGKALTGTLYHVPIEEFSRVLNAHLGSLETKELIATFCRINTLYMIAAAGSGHIGTSFSSMDLMVTIFHYIFREEMDESSKNSIFFSSKGHDAPAYYSVLASYGRIDFDLIHKLRRIEGLPGHPDVKTPEILTNTGSLGMGVSKAKGMIFARKKQNIEGKVFVMVGDGELQEGQFWESLISASNSELDDLIVVIDHNKLQSDTLVEKVSDLGDLNAKLASFGWHVLRCNGNDMGAVESVFSQALEKKGSPTIIIADTVKGSGVSFFEHTTFDHSKELYPHHSGAPTESEYLRGFQELLDHAKILCENASIDDLALESMRIPERSVQINQHKLIPAYSEELINQSKLHRNLVALDADLLLDTGLIPFQQEFPDRFIECGIAEQDMVSQAGGLALNGFIPIVHSFACFLSTRPNEQIYNNATEHKKIIYVGSLAGLLPGGPGHSHQSVRDVAALSAVPGLTIISPSSPDQVRGALQWAIATNKRSTYIRLESIPFERLERIGDDKWPSEMGQGSVIKEGFDIVMLSYGPTMLEQTLKAAHFVESRSSFSVAVIDQPWLNKISRSWFDELLEGKKLVVVVDNHYTAGGLGSAISQVMAASTLISQPLLSLGIEEVPRCGTNEEVLVHHELDAEKIAAKVLVWAKSAL